MSPKLLRLVSKYKIHLREYSLQPPEWLGGQSILLKSGKETFPEHSQTFEERLKEINGSKAIETGKNLGLNPPVVKKVNLDKILKISIANKRNKDLEKQSRLLNLLVPLEDIDIQDKVNYLFNIAKHYSIFKDLFGSDFFYPIVNLNISYSIDSDNVLPVYFGNRITPKEAKDKPLVRYDCEDENKLYSLLLISPDSNLYDSEKDIIHWMMTNIRGSDLESGSEKVKYLQPIAAQGTGYHRLIFLLFEHKDNVRVDFSDYDIQSNTSLETRSFSTKDFVKKFADSLLPVGLAFFQSCWDLSVRQAFHSLFNMEEPRFEYKHPVAYHPPAIKYPHKQPFDRYYDRYRDKKDLAEEVLKLKLSRSTVLDQTLNLDEYESVPKLISNECKYPLAHIKRDKPSWLKRKENIMHRKLEQYRQLNE